MRSALDIGFTHASLSKVWLKRERARKVAEAEGITELFMPALKVTEYRGPIAVVCWRGM